MIKFMFEFQTKGNSRNSQTAVGVEFKRIQILYVYVIYLIRLP